MVACCVLPTRAVRGAPNQAGAAQIPLSTGAAGEASGSEGMGRPLGRLEGAKGKAAVASNVARRASSWGVSFVPPASVEELVQTGVQEHAAVSKQGLAHTCWQAFIHSLELHGRHPHSILKSPVHADRVLYTPPSYSHSPYLPSSSSFCCGMGMMWPAASLPRLSRTFVPSGRYRKMVLTGFLLTGSTSMTLE